VASKIIELEEAVCQIERDIDDGNRNLRENERQIKKWTEKLQTAQSVLKLNINNKNHIKNVADIVNLKEFEAIKERIEEMQEEVKEYNFQLSIFTKARFKLQANVIANQNLLNENMQLLTTYGQIIHLKAK
jgi:hypothetical protein